MTLVTRKPQYPYCPANPCIPHIFPELSWPVLIYFWLKPLSLENDPYSQTHTHTHTHTHKGQMFILELEGSLEIILSTPLDRWGKWNIGRGCELLKDLQVANSGPRLPVYCSQSIDFVFRKVKVLNLVLLFTMWWSPCCVYSSACFPIYKIGITFSDVGTKYDYALWNTPKWLGECCSLPSSSFLLW